MALRTLLGKPAAIVPLLMSLVALMIVLGRVALVGDVHQVDEGSDAHMFELLMVAQLPIIASFAYRWIPTAPAVSLRVLGLQMCAIITALVPVAYFNL